MYLSAAPLSINAFNLLTLAHQLDAYGIVYGRFAFRDTVNNDMILAQCTSLFLAVTLDNYPTLRHFDVLYDPH